LLQGKILRVKSKKKQP